MIDYLGEGIRQVLLVGIQPSTNLSTATREPSIDRIIHSSILLAEDLKGIVGCQVILSKTWMLQTRLFTLSRYKVAITIELSAQFSR